MTFIPPSEPDQLPKSHQEALTVAGVVLMDTMLLELESLERIGREEWTIRDSSFLSRLPRVYRHRYTSRTLLDFLFIVSTVTWKLAQREEVYQLSCVAEEIALDLIIQAAAAILEDVKGIDAHFGLLWDCAYEDVDYQFLFDSSMDGFIDTPAAARAGMGHLRFDEWFWEFGEGTRGQVHPYVVDTESPIWMSGEDVE